CTPRPINRPQRTAIRPTNAGPFAPRRPRSRHSSGAPWRRRSRGSSSPPPPGGSSRPCSTGATGAWSTCSSSQPWPSPRGCSSCSRSGPAPTTSPSGSGRSLKPSTRSCSSARCSSASTPSSAGTTRL
ncbi:MAG: hypothetical protein AVDCRST_MAG22-2866, partial [uncultured Rubrobacteraceae bacterium]